MILFVFEGDRECPIFSTLQHLFFPKETEPFICVYKSNIYSLYSHIKQYDLIGGQEGVDTVSVLNEILVRQGNYELADLNPAQISEIFLFFDYDFHHNRGTLEENNLHLKELLDYFNEETETGKLYINYPMIESLRYTKALPDDDYVNYTVTRTQCSKFKGLANEFSFYNSFDHLTGSGNTNQSEEKRKRQEDDVRQNWYHLIRMNVCKANYLCNDFHSFPEMKSLIGQSQIFGAQLAKHVMTDECRVSILNSFPIFIYEYLEDLKL